MTLVVKPVGRGYRLTSTMRIEGGHMQHSLIFHPGAVFELGGVRYRVVRVQA